MMVATVFAGFSTATIIGVPLGTTISSAFSWHVSFAVISGLALIIGAFLLVLRKQRGQLVTRLSCSGIGELSSALL